MTERFKSNGSF